LSEKYQRAAAAVMPKEIGEGENNN
jgi:hypothetical protein